MCAHVRRVRDLLLAADRNTCRHRHRNIDRDVRCQRPPLKHTSLGMTQHINMDFIFCVSNLLWQQMPTHLTNGIWTVATNAKKISSGIMGHPTIHTVIVLCCNAIHWIIMICMDNRHIIYSMPDALRKK
jgi:hypothetical protein